jgi:diadenosine tetraphosphatase ApaH/serine/threonine PP2A family protein phosphatase
MRALILSDIHANIDALEAVLAAAPPFDIVWNLGDVVGYGAAPNAVADRARDIGSVFVRGNHDRACTGLMDVDGFNPVAAAAVQWTSRQLTPENTKWLRDLPQGPVTPSPLPLACTSSGHSGAVRCVHGSPRDEDEYLLSARDARAQLPLLDAGLFFFGHTHIQGGFAVNSNGECSEIKPVFSGDADAESYDLHLDAGVRYLINPGSVGQPRDRDWRAAFALYDDAAGRVSFFRVPYDVRLAQMRIHRAGLPEILGSRLRAGR